MATDQALDDSTLPVLPQLAGDDDHFSSFIGMFVVGYLEGVGGHELTQSVLAEAGEARSAAQLCDPAEWSSYGETRRLLEAMSRMLGPEALFEATATYPGSMMGSSYLEMIYAIGSATNLVSRAGELMTTLTTIATLDVAESAPYDWELVLRLSSQFEPCTELCSFFAGLFSTYPVFYGFGSAQVLEHECQAKGAPACRFRVTWDETASEVSSSEHFEYLSELLAVRLGELQHTVTDLVSLNDLETILSETVASARRTVNAPAYVLALQAMPGALREVYAQGLSDTEARALTASLAAGDPVDGTLAVEVRSAQRAYGWLVAVDLSGSRRYLPEERTLLGTYASVAAAALDVATALDQARQQTTAAEAMSALLADERALLSCIVEGLPHGVCWSDRSGSIEGANQALIDVLGYERVDDVLRRPWAELCDDPAASTQIETWTTQVSDSGQPLINAELALDRGDTTCTVLVSVVPLAPVADESRLLSIWADITSQRALEQRLADASRLESIGQLAAGIAHEINTPMQYIGDSGAFLRKAYDSVFGLIDAFAQLADSHGIDQALINELTAGARLELLRERVPNAASQVTEGVSAVSQIVRSLKTFAHPGGEDHEAVDLHEIVHSTMAVSGAAWRPVADIELRLADEPAVVRAIPGTINQALLNLVVNAAHAIEDRHTAGDERPGLITIGTSTSDDRVALVVSDNGTGIPDHIRDKVYDHFVTTKPVGRGTGQGLAICHRLVSDNHGTIDFTSSRAGTTFTVCLDRWDPGAMAPPQASAETMHTLGSRP